MPGPEPTVPRLLKARDLRGDAGGVAFNLEDLRRRCEAEIERARREAAAIRERAQREAERTGRDAFEEARRRGYEQGVREADAEVQRRATELADAWVDERLQTTLPAMQAVGEALKDERERWLARWETAVVELAVAIAEKLVRRTIAAHPEISTGLVRETLRLATGNGRVHVRLNPQDRDRLGEFSRDVAGSLADLADVALHADDSISPGGCLVETEHGGIDARLETQLNRILQELTIEE